ncbi:hypothetical protein AA0114_g8386 [Alternaria tenuissima]|uniref:DRBM domain-containing protein n=1 Tax=Alternaria tenuissima TaxID=119927 RepID=A0A4Q4M9K2_9PLEO|nr:hypothetical protein AA0114_g8386 [Alternaria tenuissima]
MYAPGEDLKRHLIVPPSSSPLSSSLTASNSTSSVSAPFNIDTVHDQQGSYDKAKKRKMKADTPTQTPAFESAHVDEIKSNSTPLDGVFKIEDFINQHKDAHQAQVLVREAKNAASAGPPSKKTKNNENVASLKPVAVGARSSKHTILLHEKYQALGTPQPLFTYGGSGETGWTVSVSFPGLDNADELQGLSADKKFNSKQEAKEAMSQKALTVLEGLEKEGRIQKAEKSKKKSAGSQPVQQVKEEKEPGENYVGQILEFQRATDSPQPTYTDYQSGQRFACILTIEGLDMEFGSINNLFSSKKAARRDAARRAVEYFKSIGTWPEDVTLVGGIKKKKAQPSIPDMVSISEPDLVPSLASTSTASPGTKSYAQQVASLAVILALPTPEWQYTSHPEDPNFHTVTCFFRGAGPHEGPIGEVRNIYGKKKAKEECARLTLEYLKDVREKRVAYGAEMMKGIAGVEGVLAAAAGKPVEGEGKNAKKDAVARRGFENKMEESSEEDEVFADALEA